MVCKYGFVVGVLWEKRGGKSGYWTSGGIRPPENRRWALFATAALFARSFASCVRVRHPARIQYSDIRRAGCPIPRRAGSHRPSRPSPRADRIPPTPQTGRVKKFDGEEGNAAFFGRGSVGGRKERGVEGTRLARDGATGRSRLHADHLARGFQVLELRALARFLPGDVPLHPEDLGGGAGQTEVRVELGIQGLSGNLYDLADPV